jgi:hypothetical protein
VLFNEDGATTKLGGSFDGDDGDNGGVDLSSVAALNAKHLAAVRLRLAATADLDKAESKARLREKKQKAKRSQEPEEQAGAPTLRMASSDSGSDDESDEDMGLESDASEESDEEGGEESEEDAAPAGKRPRQGRSAATGASVEADEAAVMAMLGGKATVKAKR